MRQTILAFPEHLATGRRAAHSSAPISAERIICCGMGGSSVAGEFLGMIRNNVIVHWDYGLPENTRANDLVVCTSWSGDTEETLSSYDAARSIGAQTLVLTTGGTLAARARADGTPYILLPRVTSVPRAAVGVMLGALATVVGSADQLTTALSPHALEGPGRQLAERIGHRIPVFYAEYRWRKIAGWFKTLYNENAKMHAWASNLPSAAHNELVGWAGPYQQTHIPVLLRHTDDAQAARTSMDAMLALWEKMRYTSVSFELSGQTPLETACNAYITGLWASYFAAAMSGVNPEAVDLIDRYKALKKKTVG